MIEYARRHRGWTLLQLSVATRIGQGFLSQIENGLMTPNADQTERLSAALDLHPGQLLQPAPDPERVGAATEVTDLG
jgi:transcriptional regulator with XRE-family HTH domain